MLLLLVNDILDLSKIENEAFWIEASPCLMVEIEQELEDLFTMQFQGKWLRLEFELDEELNENQVLIDKKRLTQVLVNLINNAYKFTMRGGVIIAIKLERSQLNISVKDTGIGIKEEDQKKLFKLFGMIDSSRDVNSTGTGLGLTICCLIIEKMDGKKLPLETKHLVIEVEKS